MANKSTNKPSTPTKTEGFLLILILLVFFLVHDHEEYPKKVDNFANHIFSRVTSLERQNKILFEASLKNELDKETLQTICTLMIEESDRSSIARGYDCLAKIYSEKSYKASIFQAIKNESYALDNEYNPQYLQNLFNYLTQGYDVKLNSNDEIEVLNQLRDSKNSDIKARALYRLSLINSLGRKSYLEERNYNLEEANNFRNQAAKLINLDQKKYINVLFILNNNQKYISYAKTTIASLLLNSDLDSEYRFYVLSDYSDTINKQNIDQLLSLQNIAPYTINFITIPENFFNNYSAFKELKTRLLFSRFAIENILPNLETLISLDVDVIALKDLYNLEHNADIHNYVLMGSVEGHKTKDINLCNFPFSYINAGVVVENLAMMREISNKETLIKEWVQTTNEKDKRCTISYEQDLINTLYNDNIGYFSNRWNYVPALNYNNRINPFIIHFAGEKYGFYNNPKYSEENKIRKAYSEFASNISLEYLIKN